MGSQSHSEDKTISNIRDFAIAEVLTAPSPATTGTSLVLKSGQGADMPILTPFKVTAFPKGVIPTKANSEILLVTARSTDTLTVTRAQGETTAKSIAADWLITNSIYADDILTGGMVFDELLAGTANGTNKVFTTSQAFTSIALSRNGVNLHIGASYDFTKTGDNQITFTTAPASGAIITGTYIVGGKVQLSGTNSSIGKELPLETPNGTRTQFTTARPYIGGTLKVYINGLFEGVKVTETTPSSGVFTLDRAYASTDDIQVGYQFATGNLGNADTVDGVHASQFFGGNDSLKSESRGWQRINASITFASFNTTTRIAVFNTSSDLSTLLYKGLKFRYSQPTDGVKYGFIVDLNSTTITVYTGTDYDLDNESITDLQVSVVQAPVGFPQDPNKWTREFKNFSQVNTGNVASASNVVNISGHDLLVGIGIWNLEYFAVGQITIGSAQQYLGLHLGLSDINNGFSDLDLWHAGSLDANGTVQSDSHFHRKKRVVHTAEKRWYMNTRASIGNNTVHYINGSSGTTIIRATCAYLGVS